MTLARCIDVSTAQGRIDWQRVRESGVSAAWIKASEGMCESPRRLAYLREAVRGARRAGLDVGAYHFSRGRDEEIHTYLAAIRGLHLTLRHVLDLEGPALDHLLEQRRAPARLVDAWRAELPGSLLYGYRSALDDHDDWGLPLYVATRPWGHDEPPPCDIEILMRHQPRIPWAAWQYASRTGRCDGVSGAVDLGLYDPAQCRLP